MRDKANEYDTATMCDIFDSAIGCLLEYRHYGESMRNIGMGFHPTGSNGESIEDVIALAISAVERLKKAEG